MTVNDSETWDTDAELRGGAGRKRVLETEGDTLESDKTPGRTVFHGDLEDRLHVPETVA